MSFTLTCKKYVLCLMYNNASKQSVDSETFLLLSYHSDIHIYLTVLQHPD